jgi:hypothetical protein
VAILSFAVRQNALPDKLFQAAAGVATRPKYMRAHLMRDAIRGVNREHDQLYGFSLNEWEKKTREQDTERCFAFIAALTDQAQDIAYLGWNAKREQIYNMTTSSFIKGAWHNAACALTQQVELSGFIARV